MKIKLHFNRINMARKLANVWSAHTSRACNASEEVLIRYEGKVIGRTVFNPAATQPRAYVEFFGDVKQESGKTYLDVAA